MATNGTQSGTVTGRYTSTLMDSENNPIPASGTLTFTPQADYILSPDNATILSTPVIAVLDSQGYLCTAETSQTTQRYTRDLKGGYIPKYRGVVLQATDDPNTNPTHWTWKVDFDLTVGDQKVNQKSFSFSLPAGSEVDLTTVTPVPGVSGYSTITGPKGDSLHFLDSQDPHTVKNPTNGDIVPFEGTLYGYSDGEWKSLIGQPSSVAHSSAIESSRQEFSGDGYSFIADIVGDSVTLSGTITSQNQVWAQLPENLYPAQELTLPLISTNGEKTTSITLFDTGNFQVLTFGTFSVSISYVRKDQE